MAQRFDDLLSPRKRKRSGSSKSATLLLFLYTPATIILLGKSKSGFTEPAWQAQKGEGEGEGEKHPFRRLLRMLGFTGLTTRRTRWKWLVTNFIYLSMHPP